MTKFITTLCLAILFSHSYSQQGLEKVIVEKYYVSDARDSALSAGRLPVGSVTYRIYVDMLPGYKFQAVYGLPGHELRLETTTSFFNNEKYGAIIPNVITSDNLVKNTTMLDSWLSVGAAGYRKFGILKTDDNGAGTVVNEEGILHNEDPRAGIPLRIQDGLIEGMPERVSLFGIDSIVNLLFRNRNAIGGGAVLSTISGSWLCLKGATGPTDDNRVLIAQLTTDGNFSFTLNIQIGASEGTIQKYVAENPAAGEIFHPHLIYRSEIKKPAGKNDAKKIN